MKATPKPAYKVGHVSVCFASKLKDAIGSLRSVSYAERIKLYNTVLALCQQQVEDCCEGLTGAMCLNLHDLYGFGQKRLTRLRDATQETIDEAAEKYDVATVQGIKRALEIRNIHLQREE